MNRLRLPLAAALFLLSGCDDPVFNQALSVQLQVVSSQVATSPTVVADARGEAGRVAVSGTYVGTCVQDLRAVALRTGRVLMMQLRPQQQQGCQANVAATEFRYEAVVNGVQPGTYQFQVRGPEDVPLVTPVDVQVR